jgi:uncharacterized membrane protein YcaP (DUF421 family)
MKPEEIHITDWMRIVMGDVPASFLVEVIIRIFFIYIMLLVLMRLMGKRMAGQFGRNEMAAIVSLAAAIGVPLQAPDRGLLPIVIIGLTIVSIQWYISRRAMQSTRFENLVMDDVNTLIRDGRMLLDRLKITRITQERLMAELRHHNIDNLGKVQRAYMEANGAFSIMQYGDARPGLSTLPGWDTGFKQEQPKAPGQFACCNCGNIVESRQKPTAACECCDEKSWDEAVVS